MNKFEKVRIALQEKTRETDNFITLTKNVDARHEGKYAIKNIATNSVGAISYKTLDEVIKEFELTI